MELSAQELRIGNYLQDSKGKLAPVEGLSKNKIKAYSGVVTTMPLKPIPLTEEWLLKLGFEYHPSRHENRAFRKGKLEIVLSGNYIYTNGRTYYNSWCIIESQPKTVHQLQNLYFALTGEELTINK